METSLKIARFFVHRNQNFIENINFGTGENTLIPEWYRLVKECGELNLKQGVTTNGSLAVVCEQNKWANDIIINYINDVDVSLDFADPTLHNALRGHPKAFQWAINTLNYCNEYGIEASIATCLLKSNCRIKYVKKLFELAETWDCNIRLNIYRPLNGPQFIVEPKQLYDVLIFILENYKLVRASDPLFSSLLGLKHAIGDSAGITSCRILPDGSITPSTFLITEKWKAGNIKDITLPSLRTTKQFRKLANAPIPIKCKNCLYIDVCQGGAKDRRILWYNDLSRRDPYCPYLHFKENPLEGVEFSVTKEDVYLVHDGYLPTLIFTS